MLGMPGSFFDFLYRLLKLLDIQGLKIGSACIEVLSRLLHLDSRVANPWLIADLALRA